MGGASPGSFERLRRLPVVGRALDWGMGDWAVSKKTKRAGARIAGLKATESVCPCPGAQPSASPSRPAP